MMTEEFSDSSQEAIERRIDVFLAKNKPFRPLEYRIPIFRASAYEYRGVKIRKWEFVTGKIRFNAAVELEDAK